MHSAAYPVCAACRCLIQMRALVGAAAINCSQAVPTQPLPQLLGIFSATVIPLPIHPPPKVHPVNCSITPQLPPCGLYHVQVIPDPSPTSVLLPMQAATSQSPHLCQQSSGKSSRRRHFQMMMVRPEQKQMLFCHTPHAICVAEPAHGPHFLYLKGPLLIKILAIL